MDNFVQAFVDFVAAAAPYVIVWRIGEKIVTTLLNCVTGGGRRKNDGFGL